MKKRIVGLMIALCVSALACAHNGEPASLSDAEVKRTFSGWLGRLGYINDQDMLQDQKSLFGQIQTAQWSLKKRDLLQKLYSLQKDAFPAFEQVARALGEMSGIIDRVPRLEELLESWKGEIRALTLSAKNAISFQSQPLKRIKQSWLPGWGSELGDLEELQSGFIDRYQGLSDLLERMREALRKQGTALIGEPETVPPLQGGEPHHALVGEEPHD